MRLLDASRTAAVFTLAVLAVLAAALPSCSGSDRPVSQSGPGPGPGPAPVVAGDAPAGAVSAGPALTVVGLDAAPVDAYLAGARVTPPEGLGRGAFADAGRRPAGPSTVEIFPHAGDAPASPAGRGDRAASVTVTVPEGPAASLVIGPTPEGAATAVHVFADDPAAPAPDTGRLVLRHTAGGGPGGLDVEAIRVGGDEHTFLAELPLAAGGEVAVDVPGGAAVHVRVQTGGSTFALPQLAEETLAVEPGRVRTAYLAPTRHERRAPVTCPASGPIPPGGAAHISTAEADLDGDGDREQTSLWSEGEGSALTWRIGVTGLGAGGATARLDGPVTFDPASPWTAPGVLGAADADGQGGDELLVAASHGGSTQGVQVWGLRGCALAAATIAGGTTGAATLAVGASASDKSGVVCTYPDGGALLSTWQARADADRDAFTITLTDYRWSAPMILRSERVTTWTRPADDEWTLLQSSGLRCGRPPYTLVQRAGGPGGGSAVTARPPFTG